MAKVIKPVVEFAESFGRLDTRVGRVVEVGLEERTRKPTYRMCVDFGRYGRKISYGRFTRHTIDEVKNRLVIGVLKFLPRPMGW